MAPMVPDSLLNLNGNMLAAVDIETTGIIPGWHEIVQVAVLPLDSEIMPSKVHRPFYFNLVPQHPDRASDKAMRVHGLDAAWLEEHAVDPCRAVDLYEEWFHSLNLPFGKRLCPLAQNWSFERGHLMHWLGMEMFDSLWHPHARDTQRVAAFMNDLAAFHGKKIPFGSLSQPSLCKKYGIRNANEHDALADCIGCAALYREIILQLGGGRS